MRFRVLIAALFGGLLAPIAPLVTSSVPPAAAAGATSAYIPLPNPQRLVDTRQNGTALAAGETRSVNVTGAAPLPAAGAISAAVLNVTVVGPAGEGFWTVYPHDAPLPDASNINVDEPARLAADAYAVPNLVTVPVGASGLVDIATTGGGQLIVDMLGYYSPASSATAGRFLPLNAPTRIVDTRQTNDPVDGGETRRVTAPGAAGAQAVVLNVTTVAWTGGFWTVFPTGQPLPTASNLNSIRPGYVSANQVIVPVDASGSFSVFSYGGGHLIVDMIGTFTGSSAPSSTVGLFVPLVAPTRFFDSRRAELNPAHTTSMLLPGWSTDVPIASNPAINRTDISAVVMNVTLNEALSAGFVTASPAGSEDPAVPFRSTSTLNATRSGQTIPNHATVPVSARGVNLFTERGGHLIVDVAGYYLGSAASAPFGAPMNVDPTPAGCLGFPGLAVRPVQLGSSKLTVSIAQGRLLDLGFWVSAKDGNYGVTTTQAVMAFQFWKGLSPTGVLDDGTASALNTTLCRPTPGVSGNDFFEVDKGKQIAKVVRGGKVVWVFHVSTGNGQTYDEPNRKFPGERENGVAVTPTGTFKVYRVADQARYEGTLGTMYRPRFVHGGVAVHGAGNVPNYPASHGCVRVVNPVADLIWGQDLLPMGGTVVIHE